MQFLKIKCNGKMIVEPLEKLGLFEHCTGGFSCMGLEEFKSKIVPILQAHGVSLITYKERD